MYVLGKNTQISVTLVLQDIFSSGAIKSATDFQVYREVAGLSGLDFAYADNTAVYHTKVLFIFPFAPIFWNIWKSSFCISYFKKEIPSLFSLDV